MLRSCISSTGGKSEVALRGRVSGYRRAIRKDASEGGVGVEEGCLHIGRVDGDQLVALLEHHRGY